MSSAGVLSFVLRGSLDRAGWDRLVPSNDPIEVVGGEGFLQLLLTGAYPAVTWMPFVFAGMALGRLDLASAATRTRMWIVGPLLAAVGYGGSWIALHVFGGAHALAASGKWDGFGELAETAAEKGMVGTDSPTWLLVASPHSGTPFEITGAVGVAITTVVCGLVAAERLPRLVRPVTAVGTMSLTAYVLHVVAIGVSGLSAQPGPPLPVLLGFIAGAVAFALVWSRFFRRGPLESLLNAATTPARRMR